ncbi:MAG: DSD1 family PLP-dependent enzyme [Firmicutes bacterium]|nr:DSD1 family PLP-dependent enzyme [Bacillota bacterium]
MSSHEYEVGLHKYDLDTPALLVDLAAVERNIRTMADLCRAAGISLRPHAKIYKATAVFAWMQLRAGAIGLTVSKLSEAETLAAAGIRDILIANQVVGSRKVQRLVNLAAYTDVIVAVDSYENIQMLSEMAQARAVQIGVLVEVNIGNDRCGVEPFGPARRMVKTILSTPGLRFRGIMGYDGHLAFVENKVEQEQRSVQAYEILVAVKNDLIESGIPVEIVSGGGSATYKSACSVHGLTELQAGTYIFNDTTYRDNGLSEFECALSVLATVVSRPDRPGAEDLAILDVGRKSISLAYGFPEVKHPRGEVFSMPQEHSRLRIQPDSPPPKIGDKVELWVKDANGTVILFDQIYAMRGDVVEAVWDLHGRGKVT